MLTALRVAVLLATLLFACSSSDAEDGGGQRSLSGVVVAIDAESISRVNSFTLKNLDKTYEIFINPNVQYDFPVSHLSAHRAAGDPVAVEVQERAGRLVAIAIKDG